MRFQWIVSILSILVSCGLLMIIIGQYQVSVMLHKSAEKVNKDLEKLNNMLTNKDLFKATVEKLVLQATKAVEELEAVLAKQSPEVETKKSENDACQAEKKTKADELAVLEKERTDNEASFKAETDAWTQEINSLKEQLSGYIPICDHVKNDPLALKLCGKSAEPAPGANTGITTQAANDIITPQAQ